MIKVNDPTVQKALEDIDKEFAKSKDVESKKLKRFDGLSLQLVEQLQEGERAIVKDTDGSFFKIYKSDGRLFKSALTEVT